MSQSFTRLRLENNYCSDVYGRQAVMVTEAQSHLHSSASDSPCCVDDDGTGGQKLIVTEETLIGVSAQLLDLLNISI